MSDVRWMWAFIDRPEGGFAAAADFWCAASATTLSARRGERGEFATFVPAVGDACLKLQGTLDGPTHGAAEASPGSQRSSRGGHIDLQVDDVAAAVERALALGGRLVVDHGAWSVLTSPAGLGLCILPWRGSQGQRTRPPVVDSPGGRIRADQVAIDVFPSGFDAELAFWADLTRWSIAPSVLPQFTLVVPAGDFPWRLLVQRLDDERPAGMHLDLACADRAAATAYHLALGASLVATHNFWTVMRDPAGGVYCLTDRGPDTGRSAGV